MCNCSHVVLPRKQVCEMATKALQVIEDRRAADDKKRIEEWMEARRQSNWYQRVLRFERKKEPTEEDARKELAIWPGFPDFPSLWGHHTEPVCNQLLATCELSGNVKQIAVSTRDMTLLNNVLSKC